MNEFSAANRRHWDEIFRLTNHDGSVPLLCSIRATRTE